MRDLREMVQESLELKDVDISAYSGLSLAYIGDGVFDLIIRSYVMSRGNMPVQKMHRRTSNIVKAVSQARMIDAIMDELSEEEQAIYKRGRNSKPHTMAKNASSVEYQKATGFEALVGFLYLSGQYERLMKLVKMGLCGIGEAQCDTKN